MQIPIEQVPLEIGEVVWEELLGSIERRRVIPVVGPELLTVEDKGKRISLYRVVAERLLAKYLDEEDVSRTVLRQHHELNDAVCAVAGRKVEGSNRPLQIRDLYPSVHAILAALLPEHQQTLTPLRELALITDFDLFATTTPDDLLARALNATRFDGAKQTDEIEYAPKLATEFRRDIPEERSSKYAAVFYLFGKSSPAPLHYAIHDEDALEFPYTLQLGGSPERILSQLRDRNLLLIGCTFADWLSRFFLRLSNSERLISNLRKKSEFLVSGQNTWDNNFVIFLQHFSHASHFYAVEPSTFVAQLYQRWRDRNPGPPTPTLGGLASEGPFSRTIFISYSTADFGAAQKFYEELNRLGGDVAWFDRKNLKPGDPWEKRIHSAIQRCRLFLPLLSANTESRDDAYFIRECNQAADRLKAVRKDRKFIIPIVIDSDYRGDAKRYTNVPDEFEGCQYGHAPKGEMSEPLRVELQEQLRALQRLREI
jgi:hypothetical protein